MKIEIMSLTDEACRERDYSQVVQIEFDGKKVFKVFDGEPEDNTISRNFSDIHNLADLFQKAFDAGARGEALEIIDTEDDEL